MTDQTFTEVHGHTIVSGWGDFGPYAFVLGHIGGRRFSRRNMLGDEAAMRDGAIRQARECAGYEYTAPTRTAAFHTGRADGKRPTYRTGGR